MPNFSRLSFLLHFHLLESQVVFSHRILCKFFTSIRSMQKTACRTLFDFMNLTILIHKSPCIDQIPAELIKAGSRMIHKFINSVQNKEKLPEQWKKSIIVPIFRKGEKTNCSNYRGMENSIQRPSVKANSICRGDQWDYQCGLQRNRSLLIFILHSSNT